MKNIFKRKMVLLSIVSLIMVNAIGCTSKTSKEYTNNETELINLANSKISEKYNVEINKEDFGYSVAKQVDENKFEKIDENDRPEIVVVTSYRVNEPKDNEVLNYIFIYNTQKNEIISTEIEIM